MCTLLGRFFESSHESFLLQRIKSESQILHYCQKEDLINSMVKVSQHVGLSKYHSTNTLSVFTSGPSMAVGSVMVDMTSLISSIGMSPTTRGRLLSS